MAADGAREPVSRRRLPIPRRVSIFCVHSYITHAPRRIDVKSRTIAASLLFLCLALRRPSPRSPGSTGRTARCASRASAELGFLSVVYHTIQFGQSGTEFNYVKNGGPGRVLPLHAHQRRGGVRAPAQGGVPLPAHRRTHGGALLHAGHGV